MASEAGETTVRPADDDNYGIKKELSHVSFEDLQKLKNKLGTKVYNNTIFGKKIKTHDHDDELKKFDKDKPLEVSAKKRVSRLMQVMPVKKTAARDPRFDRLCGEYNVKAFKKDYGFLDKVKENDIENLKKELQQTDDPEMIKKIKYLIQRLENQLRETNKRKQKQEVYDAEKKVIVETLKRGDKPQFKKKSEIKMLNLVSQYEELKNAGKLKKHIERLRKKKKTKDRKKMTKTSSID